MIVSAVAVKNWILARSLSLSLVAVTDNWASRNRICLSYVIVNVTPKWMSVDKTESVSYV